MRHLVRRWAALRVSEGMGVTSCALLTDGNHITRAAVTAANQGTTLATTDQTHAVADMGGDTEPNLFSPASPGASARYPTNRKNIGPRPPQIASPASEAAAFHPKSRPRLNAATQVASGAVREYAQASNVRT